MQAELIAAQLPSGLYDQEVPERTEPNLVGTNMVFFVLPISTPPIRHSKTLRWRNVVYGFREAA